MFFVCHPKILHKHCLQFLLGPFLLPTKDNAYEKFLGDKHRALRYVMVFSVVVNCNGYTDPEEFENKKRRKNEEELASLSLLVL